MIFQNTHILTISQHSRSAFYVLTVNGELLSAINEATVLGFNINQC